MIGYLFLSVKSGGFGDIIDDCIGGGVYNVYQLLSNLRMEAFDGAQRYRAGAGD